MAAIAAAPSTSQSGHIHSTGSFELYTGPGMYHIFNIDAGTVLDHGQAASKESWAW